MFSVLVAISKKPYSKCLWHSAHPVLFEPEKHRLDILIDEKSKRASLNQGGGAGLRTELKSGLSAEDLELS